MSSTDTIFALATAHGKSGVAVIRVSGMQAFAVFFAISGRTVLEPRRATYVALKDQESGVLIDRALAIYFPAPHSFTGEDVIELHVHGSMAVVRQLLSVLGRFSGLRLAERGEFTRRAFTHGKMDLMEAEGLADLIEAETAEQQSQALRQMQGELSDFYEKLRTGIIESLAYLEAYIDFPDEDIPEEVLSLLSERLIEISKNIRKSLDDGRRGERLREGISVVILGAPNAGKSSILNVIAGRDAAIVSHKAGTTRDVIEVQLDIGGYPVVLVDTAGIRESDEEIEAEGIRRALARGKEADIKLVVFDGAAGRADEVSMGFMDERSIAVINKSDLMLAEPCDIPVPALRVSATKGEGIEALLEAIKARIFDDFSGMEAPYITRERHRSQLIECLLYVDKSIVNKPLELRCEELRLAALAVGKITGKIQVDDVLDVIFRRFCIGK